MKIKNFQFSSHFVAGPMAGISHIGLRRLIGKFGGCGILFTEMIDAKRLLREDLRNNPRTDRAFSDIPQFFQLFVSDPIIAKNAVLKLSELNPLGIDINMGCPAPNIKKQNSGIMLMNDNEKAAFILDAIRKVYNGILSVKIRTGFLDSIEKTIEFSNKMKEAGADIIIFHPRLSNQKLKARANWKYISILKKNITIPVIGNGDIETVNDAVNYLKEYNPDGVMISRASAVKPWIFKEIKSFRNGNYDKCNIDFHEIWNDMNDTLSLYYNEKDSFEKLVKWTEYFSKNFHFGHSLLTFVRNSQSFSDAVKIGNEFIKRNT